ncbi:MAG: hypothetical protein Q8Q62_10935 [Mesorhizobium sp.]|nr:hypothetical protein [Mesorhizobium sp.]
MIPRSTRSAALLLAAALATNQAFAADMARDHDVISIRGPFEKGDTFKFQSLASGLTSDAVIRLKSPGGLTFEAIAIGLLVKRGGFKTHVESGECASACALLWLAGRTRSAHPKAKIGFHQSYDGKTKRANVSANAAVGHYIAQLGYGMKTSFYVTEAAPESMTWLTPRTGKEAGIDYTIEDIDRASPSTPVTKPSTEDRPQAIIAPVQRPAPALATVVFDDGRRYRGHVAFGSRPHGKGVMTWPTGNEYKGDWANGRRSGKGEYFEAGKLVYSGDWYNDLQNGSGVEHSDEGIYAGSFSFGMRSGLGELRYRNGDFFAGEFKNNRMHGNGTMRYAAGGVYKGQFESGLFHGKGEITYPDSARYSGEWINGERHGSGIFYYSNGNKYAGGWKSGRRSGHGVVTYADGRQISGEWSLGVKQGAAIISLGSGRYSANYVSGIPTAQ